MGAGVRLGERRAAPGAHRARPPTRARGSSCGRSPPCPSSSTRTRRWRRLLRERGAAAGHLPLLRQRRPRAAPPEERRIYVGAKLLDPSGELVARYHKIRLVPFGEYVPLQPLLHARRALRGQARPGGLGLHARDRGRAPGSSTATGSAASSATRPSSRPSCGASPPGGRSCSSTSRTTPGTGRTSAPYQHLAMAAFRAVENRRYLVRAANTGITAVVDPWGRVLERDAPLRHDRPRARGAVRRGDHLLHPPRRRLRPGLRGGLALAALVAADVPRGPAVDARDRDGRRRHPLSADLMQRLESLRARAADIRGYL